MCYRLVSSDNGQCYFMFFFILITTYRERKKGKQKNPASRQHRDALNLQLGRPVLSLTGLIIPSIGDYIENHPTLPSSTTDVRLYAAHSSSSRGVSNCISRFIYMIRFFSVVLSPSNGISQFILIDGSSPCRH